ncbi:vesicular glutamate transporter 2-like isoform X2 [Lineus longissimus]|uniref:vesicular glutamate transporter 2-like isoform X2 n=1 Tax=Lineus longissimus TaxID=88925 RepID=UPI00315DE4AE
MTAEKSEQPKKSEKSESEAANLIKRNRQECACPCYCLPKRYIIVALCFFGMFVIHAMRVNVAVAVVTILDAEAHLKVGSKKAQLTPTNTTNSTLPQVNWDSRMVGFLHSIFYIGFLITQIPGGFLATKCPGHKIYGACILTSASLNLLLPVGISEVGYEFTCAVRFLQGLSEGFSFPALYCILRHWITPSGLSSMASMTVTGVYAGAIFGFPISGFITHYTGWQYVFYIFGGIGIVWFLFWLMLAYERPAYHPYITPEELSYIETSQGETAIVYQDEKIPWRAILTSVPVFALCVAHFARSWMFFLLLTNEPTYLNVFGYSIAQNGVLSAIPHVIMVIMSGMSGHIADWLIRNPMLSTTQVRRLLTCVGFGVEGSCCLFLSFIENGNLAMIFLSVGVGFSGICTSGWQINHLDIAPRYASVLIGLSTAFGTIGGIMAPLIVGLITYKQGELFKLMPNDPDVRRGTIFTWQMSWLLTGLVLFLGAIFYGLFGSGEKQSWAVPSPGSVKIASPVNPVATPPYSTVKAQVGEDDPKAESSGDEKTPIANGVEADGSRKRYGSNKTE